MNTALHTRSDFHSEARERGDRPPARLAGGPDELREGEGQKSHGDLSIAQQSIPQTKTILMRRS